MAKNTNPVFGLDGTIGAITVTTANTAKDGSGTINTLVTGNANGTRISHMQAISSQASPAANTNSVVRFFISLDSGTTWFLFREVTFANVTGSNTAIGQFQELYFPEGILLEGTAQRIGVTHSVYSGAQDRVDFIARGTIQGV